MGSLWYKPRRNPRPRVYWCPGQYGGVGLLVFVALQLCPPLQFGPLTYQPIEWGFISSNQSAL